MISDSPSQDNDMPQQAGRPPVASRRAAWEYQGDVDWQPFSVQVPLDIVWSGIVIAAACYPLVVGAIILVAMGWPFGFEGFSFDVAATILWVSLVCFVIGLFYGILMTVPAYFATQFIRWILKGVISERGVSGIYGGMTGFLCVSGGGFFIASEMYAMRTLDTWLPMVFALLLAVVMGYVGAIWAGYRKQKAGFPFFEPIFSFDKQITIGYLMKLTFLVAALSVAFKAAGPLGLSIGISWLVYLLVQTLLLVCDHWLTGWLSRR